VHCDAVLGEEIREKLARLTWSLWHGNLSKALYNPTATLLEHTLLTQGFKSTSKAVSLVAGD